MLVRYRTQDISTVLFLELTSERDANEQEITPFNYVNR
jgi:hypothetical protein